MGYIGKVPADVLIDPHVDSASIVDSTIVTADIANDAVTSAKLAQNSVDSSELIDGSVDNSHLAGSIAINKTLLSAGTGLTLSTNTLNVDAAQTQITSVGTIATGVWNGTKVASAYLDDDTAHLSTNQTFSGIKTFGADYTSFNGTGYIRGDNANKLTLQMGSSGFELKNNAYNATRLTITDAGTATFAGAITQGSGTLTIKNASGDSNGLKIYQDSSDVARIYNHYDGTLVFGVNNAEKLSIDGDTNVTIGTFGMTSPHTTYRHLNAGGFGVMHREAYDSYLMSNCYYNSSGEFIAKYSHSEGISGLYLLGGVTSLYTYSGSVTAGTAYTVSERFRFHQSGTLQAGAGAVGATNAANWQSVVKSTTGGTISSGGGMGYFALGDNYTTSDAILMVRNDGNRGSFRHASGSSLIKAQFNDATAFEVTKDGVIKGKQGAPARIAGNWEVVDVLSAEDNQSSYLQSDNCFNDNIYSQFKIVIPYINADTANATLLFTFMYNSGSGLTEQTGDYYTSMDISPHTASSYSGGVQSNATRAELFGAMHGHLAVGVSGEMNIYDAFIADLREYNQFTANTMRSGDGNLDGDRGSNYRPMIDARFLGYNTAYSAYVSQRSMIRQNTDRHASYWKGFRIQASSGNLGAKSQIIVLGRAL
tara:strand:+ start:246 stop:2195 length:1950 start_codon:yes stop_codon:yes gene_type:complete